MMLHASIDAACIQWKILFPHMNALEDKIDTSEFWTTTYIIPHTFLEYFLSDLVSLVLWSTDIFGLWSPQNVFGPPASAIVPLKFLGPGLRISCNLCQPAEWQCSKPHPYPDIFIHIYLPCGGSPHSVEKNILNRFSLLHSSSSPRSSC